MPKKNATKKIMSDDETSTSVITTTSPTNPISNPDDLTDNFADILQLSDGELSMRDLRRLRNMCCLEHTKHRLAQQKLSFKNFWMFTLTTVTITMAAGIASFVAGSDIVSEEIAKYLAVIVGAMSFFNIFLQKISRTTKYGSRSDMHHSAAIDFCLIASDIDFRMIATKSKQEKAKRLKQRTSASRDTDANPPSEETPEQKEEIDRVIHGYNTAIKQVVSGCKSLMPQDIDQTFELCLADYRMQMYSKDANDKLLEIAGKKSPNLMGALFTECGMLIATTKSWPVWDVKPKTIVDQAYENIKAKAKKSDEHLVIFLGR